MISLGRVYRRETPDATHSPVFHQVEGLAVDRGITMADLKGTLLHLMRALFGAEREMRFRTHYFPFTEPSLELDVSCFLCGGAGCACAAVRLDRAGRLRDGRSERARVRRLRPRGVDGIRVRDGLERIAMLRHGIPEIAPFWENDLRFLRQF